MTAADGQRRRVLLTDFGIARRIDDVSNLTDTNVALGTISYVAPEQLLGKPLDGRADQYALAATTFHLLTGVPPFQGATPAVVISHHLGTPPPRISDHRPISRTSMACWQRRWQKTPTSGTRVGVFCQRLFQHAIEVREIGPVVPISAVVACLRWWLRSPQRELRLEKVARLSAGERSWETSAY